MVKQAKEDDFLRNYQKVDKPIGEGTYGMVYKAKCMKTGRLVALKKVRISDDIEGLPATTLREVSFLMNLDHPNVVKLYDFHHVLDPQRVYLVFEWVNSDLRKYMVSRKSPLNAMEVQHLMYQLLLGLEHCHVRKIFHRDLKPHNILIKPGKIPRLKLADFGLSRYYMIPMKKYTHEVVTLWYRAPEVLLNCKTYGLALDMWSVGTIFGEIADKRFNAMFAAECEIGQLFTIFQFLGTPCEETIPGLTSWRGYNSKFPNWEVSETDLDAKYAKRFHKSIPQEGRNLLKEMLRLNPAKRISCSASLSHNYFRIDPLKEL
eukprot:maker-scaffold_5-snap-gene-18.59-mRNA-1 protein AED:0.01 eAED:0.01 QI:144/1/1/1/1/1/2/63/317